MEAELQTGVRLDEAELVLEWRFEELIRAGWPRELADVLAASTDVDLHAALDLLRQGCPAETAARILL